MTDRLKRIVFCLLGTVLFITLPGCQEGHMERAGKAVDEAVEDTGEALEDAGEAVEDAIEEQKKQG